MDQRTSNVLGSSDRLEADVFALTFLLDHNIRQTRMEAMSTYTHTYTNKQSRINNKWSNKRWEIKNKKTRRSITKSRISHSVLLIIFFDSAVANVRIPATLQVQQRGHHLRHVRASRACDHWKKDWYYLRVRATPERKRPAWMDIGNSMTH